jgi:hypothetical protein
VAVAWFALAAAAWGLHEWAVAHKPWQGDWWDDPVRVLLNPWSFGVLLVGLLLAIAAMARMTAAWFGGRDMPPSLRVRVMAVGHYASAILALVPALTMTSVAAWGSSEGFDRYPAGAGQILADLLTRLTPLPLFLGGGLIVAWAGLTYFLLRATCHTRRRAVAAAALLPIGWTTAFVLIPLALQLLVTMVVLMIRSLSW